MKQTSLILILVLTTTTYAFAPSYTCKMTSSSLFSTPEDEEPTELILGSEMSNALQGIGSEAGYLDYAKKRNEEAKARLMEDMRREEEETARKRAEMEAKGNAENYGPGDLSNFVGFENDGFEASAGNDETGGWGEVKEEEEEPPSEEEPKLFLFGDEDDGATGGSGLIL